jgi:hypothetical protein
MVLAWICELVWDSEIGVYAEMYPLAMTWGSINTAELMNDAHGRLIML